MQLIKNASNEKLRGGFYTLEPIVDILWILTPHSSDIDPSF